MNNSLDYICSHLEDDTFYGFNTTEKINDDSDNRNLAIFLKMNIIKKIKQYYRNGIHGHMPMHSRHKHRGNTSADVQKMID